MYLKSLILKGFKSFADRSVLTLEPGITAIVGPNGSGKSNISDAVLWVLGERNAKHLRGQAMEDVIFSGSSMRKPSGMAEVDLVLDNSDGVLPVDYSEVVITRRMYRSGESDYLINGNSVRRMDVLDILNDSGLGSGAHSIISQGTLDSVLQSKPEDRRALIEEAAGVLKHKQRKARSERKLELMDQHLCRVRDIVGEISRQLGPLERRAKKAHTFADLSARLNEITLNLAVDDLRKLQEEWKKIQQSEQNLQSRQSEKKSNIEEIEKDIEILEEHIRTESEGFGAISQLLHRGSSMVERLDSTILVIRERHHGAITRSAELQASLDLAQADFDHAQAELQQAQAQDCEIKEQYEQTDKRVNDLDNACLEFNSKQQDLEEELSAAESDIAQFSDQIESDKLKLAQNQEILSNKLAQMKVLTEQLSDLELQIASAEADFESSNDELKTIEDALSSLDEEAESARKLVDACLQARQATRSAYNEAQNAESSLEAQIKSLEEIEKTNLAQDGSARMWLAQHGDELIGGIEPLTQVIHVDPQREALVETLLGPDMTSMLIDDAACACTVASALCDAEQFGEVTLILRNDCDSSNDEAYKPRALNYPADAPGTPLINEIEYPQSAERAVSALLGDVVVCETLDDALRAHGADMLSLRFATNDGAVVWASGKITLGSAVREGDDGVLARTRHIADLKTGLIEAQKATQKALVDSEDAEDSLSSAQSASFELSQKLATLRGSAEAARSLVLHNEEKLASLKQDFEKAVQQQTQEQEIIDQSRPESQCFTEQIADLQVKLDKAKDDQARIIAVLDPLREESRKSAEELTQAKLDAAKLAERKNFVELNLAERKRDLEKLSVQISEDRTLLKDKRISAKRLELLLALFDRLMKSAQHCVEDLEEKSNSAQDSSHGSYSQLDHARNTLRSAHAELDEINEHLNDVRIELGRMELQVEKAINVIEEDCDTSLETAISLPEIEDRAAYEDDALRLRKRIAHLGTINPDAYQDYLEIKERYDYMNAQLTDMQAARRSLSKINSVIDERMRDDFIDTFNTINTAFNEIFSLLFPGGNAYLSLVDSDDIDNTGIEVIAQPKGKRITKMSLLSGGEKSLTALALLFALYRSRRAPFYFLDEVEAALDDINLQRLVSYLDKIRHTTQLIMITHQRRTMEMADVLFGVSMQADGVTKVVSQKLPSA